MSIDEEIAAEVYDAGDDGYCDCAACWDDVCEDDDVPLEQAPVAPLRVPLIEIARAA